MALVQKAPLGGGGLGGQGRPEEAALGVKEPPEAGEKGGVGLRQGAGEVFKIHVQTGVAPAENSLQDLGEQLFLDGAVRQDQLGRWVSNWPDSVRVDRCITGRVPRRRAAESMASSSRGSRPPAAVMP